VPGSPPLQQRGTRLTEHLLLRADDAHDHFEIRLRVTNCGALAHTVAMEARRPGSGGSR